MRCTLRLRTDPSLLRADRPAVPVMAGRFRFHALWCQRGYGNAPVDQHGTECQTHGRAGGVRRTQTGMGKDP